jgi:hypothetical protein
VALTAAANLVGCGAVVYAAARVIAGATAVAKINKVLDAAAAKLLASKDGCSDSDAMRSSLIHQPA